MFDKTHSGYCANTIYAQAWIRFNLHFIEEEWDILQQSNILKYIKDIHIEYDGS